LLARFVQSFTAVVADTCIAAGGRRCAATRLLLLVLLLPGGRLAAGRRSMNILPDIGQVAHWARLWDALHVRRRVLEVRACRTAHSSSASSSFPPSHVLAGLPEVAAGIGCWGYHSIWSS